MNREIQNNKETQSLMDYTAMVNYALWFVVVLLFLLFLLGGEPAFVNAAVVLVAVYLLK